MLSEYRNALLKVVILPAILMTVIVVVLISVPGYFLSEEVGKLEQTFKQKRRQFITEMNQVKFLIDQYALFKKYGDLFYDLEARGLVTAVHRPQWIDNILLFGYAYMFPRLNAQFMPYKTLPPNSKVDKFTLRSKIFSSNPIAFNASMPLDVDFFRLVDFVNTRVSYYNYFERCEFSSPYVKRFLDGKHRAGAIPSLFTGRKGLGATVEMQCQLNIITAQPKKRKG